MLKNLNNQSGQVIIVLLLTMLGALVVGIIVTQRSLTNVATSTQTEQVSRAFSAAEAGIEKAITTGGEIVITEAELGNQSSAKAKMPIRVPQLAQALEYPPIGKETVAQFWLIDPNLSPDFTPANRGVYLASPYFGYCGNKFDLYFGNSNLALPGNENNADTPAVEVNLITWDYSPAASGGQQFKTNRYYFDPLASTRRNGFRDCNGNVSPPVACNGAPNLINTSSSPNDQVTDRQFRAKVTVPPADITLSNQVMLMARVRVLYSNNSQAIAIKPVAPSPSEVCSLPEQAKIYTSTGISGQTQKTIQVFRLDKAASPFFDYAVFSAGSLAK